MTVAACTGDPQLSLRNNALNDILRGSWDLVTTYNWAYTILVIGVTHIWPGRRTRSGAITPDISSYYVP